MVVTPALFAGHFIPVRYKPRATVSVTATFPPLLSSDGAHALSAGSRPKTATNLTLEDVERMGVSPYCMSQPGSWGFATPPWVEQRVAVLQVGCAGSAQPVMVEHSHVLKSLQTTQPPHRPPTEHAGNRTGLVQLEL